MAEKTFEEQCGNMLGSIHTVLPASNEKVQLWNFLCDNVEGPQDIKAFNDALRKHAKDFDERMVGWYWGFLDAVCVLKGIAC